MQYCNTRLIATQWRRYRKATGTKVSFCQGCGLGRDVSVSRRSRDVITSRLSFVSVSEQYVSVSAQKVSCTSLLFAPFSIPRMRLRLGLCALQTSYLVGKGLAPSPQNSIFTVGFWLRFGTHVGVSMLICFRKIFVPSKNKVGLTPLWQRF